MSKYNLIGKDYSPSDMVAKVTGRAKYAEDFRAEGMLFAKLLLSPMPHAIVRRLDTSAALAMEGVEAVLTTDEVPAVDAPGEAALTNEPLYEGEPILAVAAVDETTAAEAIERIRLDLEPLPFVIDPLESLRPGGPNARRDGNVVIEKQLQTLKWTPDDFDKADRGQLPMGRPTEEWSAGDLQAGFDQADWIQDETVVHQSLTHHPLESRSTLAYWQNGKLFVHGSTQSTARTVGAIARWVGIDPSKVVFIGEYTGGAFGSKIAGTLQMVIPAMLAKKTGRPVLMRVTREEEHCFGRARPGFQARAKMGWRKDGRLTALDLYIVQDNGPYGRRGDFVSASNYASLMYQPMAMRFRGVSVFTNTPPRGPQRAPGGAQINTMLEPLLDKAARQLGVDRVALRRVNAPAQGTKYGSGQRTVTSAYVREALDKGAILFRWEEMKKLSGQRRGTKVTGVGVGQGCYSAGSIGYDGLLLIRPDGKLQIHSGCGNLGTQSYTDTARAAAEVLGMRWEDCEVIWGNTSKHLPWSCYQGGSQTIHAHTRANFAAGTDAKRKLQRVAARALGGSPGAYQVSNGRVFQKGNPSRGLSFAEAARRAIQWGGELSGEKLPEELNPMTLEAARSLAGQGLMGVAKDTLGREGYTVAFAIGFARVEVDVETGHVDLVDYIAVADCGTVVNPRGLGAQLHGGGVQGFGTALTQKWIYDPQWGLPFTKTFYTAKPPGILDVPLVMKWDAVNLPDPFNPFGAKGIGEPPVGAGAAAVLCAVADAMGEGYFGRTPVMTDMILNVLAAQPQPFGALTAHV